MSYISVRSSIFTLRTHNHCTITVPMAPKTAPARISLANLTQSAQAPMRQQANLVTLEVTIDEVQLDGNNGETYKAIRAVVAHGGSVTAGAPAQYHGLNTFTPRSLACMHLPPVPQGVVEATSGLVPPETNKNPYKSISWVYMLIAYGINATSSKRAATFVADKIVAVLTQALLEVNVEVHSSDTKTAWSASASIEGNRIKITRTGTKLAGGTYTIQELSHIKFRLESTLPPNIKKIFTGFAKPYASVITISEIERGTSFPTVLAPPKTTKPLAEMPQRPRAVAKSITVKKTISKAKAAPKTKASPENPGTVTNLVRKMLAINKKPAANE